MEKLQITKGEWGLESRTYKVDPKEIITGIKIDLSENYSMRVLDTILPDSDSEYIEAHNEIRSNILLACDAANTYQQCETLPSELLRQNREMKEAIKTALSYFESCKDHWEEGESIVYHDLFNACNKGKE